MTTALETDTDTGLFGPHSNDIGPFLVSTVAVPRPASTKMTSSQSCRAGTLEAPGAISPTYMPASDSAPIMS